MKAIILAAGYATRLYPLTKDKPKPLLTVAKKPIIHYIVESIARVRKIDQIFVVTNAKFVQTFQNWAVTFDYSQIENEPEITIVNDGTTSNETRLGAIADIQLVINQHNVADDLLVIAGDNIFTFNFNEMVDLRHQLGASIICGFEEDNVEKLNRTGVIEKDEHQRVIGFEEKPKVPKSNIACPAIYVYRKEDLHLIEKYLTLGFNPDAPGHLIPFLIKHVPLYVYIMKDKMFDIGNLESYNEVRAEFEDYEQI